MKRHPILLVVLVYTFASFVTHGQTTTTEVRYLSGTGKDDAVLWDFYCTEGRKRGVWTKIRVPSNWELEGFGAYQYGGDHQKETNPFPKEQGKYKHSFQVPTSWQIRVVRLVFEGSMTDTEVSINGKSVGPVHQGSFYQFKYDITSLLKFGESNLLEVTVSKESSNASVNNAERRGDYWNFGGIFRPVYLEVLPKSFLDWTAVDARADGSFAVDVNLGGKIPEGSKVTGQIVDAAGRPVGRPFSTPVSSTEKTIRLTTNVSSPKLWTAETPNLYRVRLTLTGATALHSITERFGFRTFEVRKGDGFYLNGQRILLKGVNRHSFWPDSGRTLSKQISYDDVKLIKEMNMNAVRMSHYPPDSHFLEVCDELGLYVLDELGGWQKAYDTPTGRRLIGQIVRRDVNHPSIVLWDNGNEGGWNVANDDEFARWDPQKREVLHPWEKFRLTNTDHYEKFDSHTRLSNGPDIYMPTEFLHGLYDGGIGAGLWDYWELIRNSKVGGGGFFWALVDECVKRTDDNGRLDCAGNRGPDGIVGPHREREGSFNTVREIWSPVVLNAMITGDTAVIKTENRYDFTNLRDCTFEWQVAEFLQPSDLGKVHKVIASGKIPSPNVAPHSIGELKLKVPQARTAHVLYVTVKDPNGRLIWTWSWSLKPNVLKSVSFGRPLISRDNGNLLEVTNGDVKLTFSKESGLLLGVENRSVPTPFHSGPELIAYRRNDRKYESLAAPGRVTHFETHRQGATIVVESKFEGALKSTTWRIHTAGAGSIDAQLDYEYAFDGEVDVLGIKFTADEKQLQSIRWLGLGPYRVWQNRLEGTRLDVWENAYNDSMPGVSWIYPEFKGYFRGVRWAQFQTNLSSFTLGTNNGDFYLGLFKPGDGVNGLLDFPDVGIAVLDVIPAMRNKFHTTDEIGPQSKRKHVSGSVRRTIQLMF